MGTPIPNEGGSERAYTMQDVRRAMSDQDLVEERDRLANLDEMSRCEEIRLEIVQDEWERRQALVVREGSDALAGPAKTTK